jgi:hypothetical protein
MPTSSWRIPKNLFLQQFYWRNILDKREIIHTLNETRKDFLETIEGIPEESMLEAGVVDGWSIKDLLAHIALWESELVKLLWETSMGASPTTAHFKRLSVDKLNERWYQENKDRPLERIMADFEGVRKQTLRRVEAFTDEDLTEPGRFPWLKDAPLWKWIANDSFEHESEHLVQIKAWREQKDL